MSSTLQNYEINNSKYVTLIGYVQSGKTNELLNYCYQSTSFFKMPVIFILRNMNTDLLQLLNRFDTFANIPLSKIRSISQLYSSGDGINEVLRLLQENGIIILLCNRYQLDKVLEPLSIFVQGEGKYNVCIDEVDFSIKSKDFTSKIDKRMKRIKLHANHILGATATPFAVFLSDNKLTKIKKIDVAKNYNGINSLNIKFVEPVIIKNKNLFPYCDYRAIKEIYSSCAEKEYSVLLHTVLKEKIFHRLLSDYIRKKYPLFTVVIYNGDGIIVKSCKKLKGIKGILIDETNITTIFSNSAYSISDVLQILKNNKCSHISIISGHLASRGISFVSSDYSIHLTDQYFHPGKKSHGENLLQSLRLLGCYKDSPHLTLWCSKNTWESILSQQLLIESVVNSCDDSTNWFSKIQELIIKKPEIQITRKRIDNTPTWLPDKMVIPEIDNYNLSDSESESESESEN